VESCPIGIRSNNVPNCASLIERAVLMIGIRLAQEEKTSPWAKKSKKQAVGIFALKDWFSFIIKGE
jgi:hypothetical protein